MNSSLDVTIGEAVRALRERAGWTQGELAERAAFAHHQTVSAIEKGERSLKATELALLAEILRVEARDLLAGRIPVSSDLVLWRQVKNSRAKGGEEAVFLKRCRRYAFVERLIDEGPEPNLPSYQLDPEKTSYETVERWAGLFGKALGLGEVPALTLRRVLEEHAGVKVFLAPLKGGSRAAAHGDFGDAILENVDEIKTRLAFSLGHELFHLLTWEAVKTLSPEQESRNEKLANVFARTLILPFDGIRERIGAQAVETWQWHRFLSHADAFAVSPSVLLWRLKHMGLLSESRVEVLLAFPRRNNGPVIPQPDSLETEPVLPRRFVLLAFQAWVEGHISIGKLSELLETTVGMLEPRLGEHGLNLDEDADEATVLSA